jgi:hypothetical protein
MVFIVIRITGKDLVIDTFLSRSGLGVSSIWRKGETARTGRVNDDSGFTLAFPEGESWAHSLPTVRAHFQAEAALFRELRSRNAEVELDIGVTVGEDQSFAPSLAFPTEFMAELVSLGVSLKVSAYPTSNTT